MYFVSCSGSITSEKSFIRMRSVQTLYTNDLIRVSSLEGVTSCTARRLFECYVITFITSTECFSHIWSSSAKYFCVDCFTALLFLIRYSSGSSCVMLETYVLYSVVLCSFRWWWFARSVPLKSQYDFSLAVVILVIEGIAVRLVGNRSQLWRAYPLPHLPRWLPQFFCLNFI
jgi:hypothetical protein